MTTVRPPQASFLQPWVREEEEESLQTLSVNNKLLKKDILSNHAFVASCQQEMQRLESLSRNTDEDMNSRRLE